MKMFSKVCDGADWFCPGFLEIIEADLREPARFHRKQWEFAMILHVLRESGKLGRDVRGLSMGGGRERVLYALTRHVRELVVTDLYDPATTWECARTGDPEEFIKSDPPFPVDTTRISVLNADMRDLPFGPGIFDFCYSTCAVEHIGGKDDFQRHFEEVGRVLKDGGVYVFTTEFHYGPETITDPENFIFSWEYLCDLLLSSGLVPEPVFDARLTPHALNDPRPSNIQHLCSAEDTHIARALIEELPHLQLLRGRHPFTAALFVLRKEGEASKRVPPRIVGYEKSRLFLEKGIERYRDMLNRTVTRIHPFSSLPGGVSPHFVDHASFFTGRGGDMDNTAFHTDYFWWGKGKRVFRVHLESSQPRDVEVRLHGYKTLASHEVFPVLERVVKGNKESTVTMEFDAEDEWCYAVLGKTGGGGAEFTRISIESSPGGEQRNHLNWKEKPNNLLASL